MSRIKEMSTPLNNMLYRIRLIGQKPFLAHHGIDGQKWGVRNGPPYPLDRETHTKVIREGYKRDRSLSEQGKLSKSKLRGSFHFTNSKYDYQWKEVMMLSDGSTGDEKRNVAYYIGQDENNSEFRFKDNAIPSYSHIRRNVNLDFGAPGTVNNCMKCTAACELMRRGYDVQAGRSFYGASYRATPYWFDGAVQYKEQGSDAAAARLEKVFGNNGRGEVTYRYSEGGGHSVYAYRDKEGCHLLCGQSAQIRSAGSWKELLDSVGWHWGADLDGVFTVTRLDTASRVEMKYKKQASNLWNVPEGQFGFQVKEDPWEKGSNLKYW